MGDHKTDRRSILKALGIGGAAIAAVPLELFANRHRSVNRSATTPGTDSHLGIARPERTYNGEFLGQMAEHFRGEVFRKRFDPVHSPRDSNYKWGWQLGIFDFGCENYRLQLINEFDDNCPDPTAPGGKKQNPQRRLNTHFFADEACDPDIRWRRQDYLSALVENATDDDFMKIYNTQRNEFQIDNLKRDSSISVPGAFREEKADRYQESNNPGGLGLNLSSQLETGINQEHMYNLLIWLQARNDPWTIYTVGQATDGAGNPQCDQYAITSYVVDFPEGDGTMGQPTRLHKTLAGVLHWKDNHMVRTFVDTSVHGSPEIYAGEPAFDGQGRSIFQYGLTNKYKIDAHNAETYVPVEELVQKWTGKVDALPVNFWDSGKPVYRG